MEIGTVFSNPKGHLLCILTDLLKSLFQTTFSAVDFISETNLQFCLQCTQSVDELNQKLI